MSLRWLQVISTGIATAGLVLAEIVLSNYANYQYPEELLTFIPMLLFAAIAIGNLIGLIPGLSERGLHIWILSSSLLTGISIYGLAHQSSFGMIWLTLPFVAYGIYLSRIFGVISLPTLVMGLGLGGATLYLLLGLTFQQIAPYLPILTVLFPTVAAVFHERSRKCLLVAIIFICGAFYSQSRDYFEPQYRMIKEVEKLKDSKKAAEPRYSPLIRTDVVKTKEDQYVIITNGRRFAVVGDKETNERANSIERLAPSYDIPYVFAKPKKVLVIGSAEGRNLRSALKHGAESVTAVDINEAVFNIMNGPLKEESLGIYSDPRVKNVTSEGRHYLETTDEKFDLITMQGVQTGSRDNPLSMAMIESYLLTQESLITLWNRLTPNGMIWIEEYKYPLNYRDLTLVRQMASMARSSLSFENFDQQHVLFEYRQASENPHGENRKLREGLLLSRVPIANRESLSDETVQKMRVAKVDVPSSESLKNVHHKDDNRPFYVRETLKILKGQLYAAAFTFLLLVATALALFLGTSSTAKLLNFSLFFIGIGFMLVVSSALGPLMLFLGEPQYATPVLFITTYVFGIVGGFISFSINKNQSRQYLWALVGYLALLPFILIALKPFFLSQESIFIRIVLSVLLFAPCAVLMELPYIWILGRFEGAARSRAYTVENLGTFAGIPIGIWCQFTFGFYGTMLAAAIAFIFAGLFLNRELQPKGLRYSYLILVPLLIGFFLWQLEEPYKKVWLATKLPVKETQDCETAAAATEIEVAEPNAKTLEREGRVRVLVSPTEGCYKVGGELFLSSIKRSQKTKTIFMKTPFFFVNLKWLERGRLFTFNRRQQEYLTTKWGNKVHDLQFDELTLVRSKDQKKPSPQEFVHPAIKISNNHDILKILQKPLLLTFADVPLDKKYFSGLETKTANDVAPTIEDPENESGNGFSKILEKIDTNRPIVIVGRGRMDLRAYNLATQLSIQKFPHVYWLQEEQ